MIASIIRRTVGYGDTARHAQDCHGRASTGRPFDVRRESRGPQILVDGSRPATSRLRGRLGSHADHGPDGEHDADQAAPYFEGTAGYGTFNHQAIMQRRMAIPGPPRTTGTRPLSHRSTTSAIGRQAAT